MQQIAYNNGVTLHLPVMQTHRISSSMRCMLTRARQYLPGEDFRRVEKVWVLGEMASHGSSSFYQSHMFATGM